MRGAKRFNQLYDYTVHPSISSPSSSLGEGSNLLLAQIVHESNPHHQAGSPVNFKKSYAESQHTKVEHLILGWVIGE